MTRRANRTLLQFCADVKFPVELDHFRSVVFQTLHHVIVDIRFLYSIAYILN